MSMDIAPFKLGGFNFMRDEYFAHITWPGGSHTTAVDAFLRSLMRDVSWNFFYGIVNFDSVFGTANHYGTVDVFAGLYNAGYRAQNKHHVENLKGDDVARAVRGDARRLDQRRLRSIRGARGNRHPFGPKRGSNPKAINRKRLVATRMTGMKGDIPLRSDAAGNPVNRQFLDVPQDEPEVHAEPGFENEVHAYNFFAYVSRSDVTWNPSVCSVVKDSQVCATTEEFMLPIIHGNDRVEWFVQLSDEIHWDIQDRETGAPRARAVMKAGDVAAMPADIRHQGYSPKRSMLLVWENNDTHAAREIREWEAEGEPGRFLAALSKFAARFSCGDPRGFAGFRRSLRG